MNLLILIGCPSSGKTSLATIWATQNPDYQIISTDAIRAELFGNESKQGDWQQIEKEVFRQIEEQLQAGKSIIYDATNAKRPWRIDFIQKLKQLGSLDVIGLHLQTPLDVCQQWNQQRQRQVPESVIEDYYQSLKNFPPIAAEGFSAVYEVPFHNNQLELEPVLRKIQGLSRSQINRDNRTKNQKAQFHQYSRLLDFERLLYLISLLTRYPGIGNLQQTNPQLLAELLGHQQTLATSVDELAAVLSRQVSPLYADKTVIADDLAWLTRYGFMGEPANFQELSLDCWEANDIVAHPYSEVEPFSRLMKVLRFILHHPFIYQPQGGSLKSLVSQLQAEGIIDYDCEASVRKDFEKILKPYQILPNFPLKKGYFIGTAILPKSELVQVFRLLEAQAKSLAEPLSLSSYETFRNNLQQAQITVPQLYPVRAIYNRTIVDLDQLPESSLAHRVSDLESAIEQGQLLELNRLKGGGRFTDDPDRFFLAYPIQLVFHNIGWYLAFECADDEQKGLFKFERLDRLFLGKPQTAYRERKQQETALKHLKQLYESSGGIYLGNSAQEQKKYLGTSSQEKAQVEITIELWFTDFIFRFISEGTRRFPLKQMQMSPPLRETERSASQQKAPFTLKKTGDPQFPNRFRVVVPKWCLDDIDLMRWIVGFGGQVKVIQSPSLIEKVKAHGTAIAELYQDLTG